LKNQYVLTGETKGLPENTDRKTGTFILKMNRACLAGLQLLQKRLRLWLLWWSGFSGGVESFLKKFGKIAPPVDF
jgi:hypothetical protein